MFSGFIKFYTILVIFLSLKSIKCSSTKVVIGSQLPQPANVNCSSFATSAYNHYKMFCAYGNYEVWMEDKPNKNFTDSLFCPPSPKLSYYFWDNVRDKDNNLNVTVCKMEMLPRSKEFVLTCKEVYADTVHCRTTYLEEEMESDSAVITTSETTKSSFTLVHSSTTRSIETTKIFSTLVEVSTDTAIQSFATTIFALLPENLWKLSTFILLGLNLAAFITWLWCGRAKYKKKYQEVNSINLQLEQLIKGSRPNPYIINNIDKILDEHEQEKNL